MKPAQIMVLAVALGAGLLAGVMALSMGNREPPPAPVAEAPAAPKIETDQVLVANRDIGMGAAVAAEDLVWTDWPKANLMEFLITKSARPNAVEELAGSVARVPFLSGEPLREARLMKSDRGFMSVILPAGMRAVAVEVKAASTAGGFILPNDRVDVILTRAAPKNMAGGDAYVSETILANIRILAIDQQISEKSGEAAVVARETATLELAPAQAETMTQAMQLGTISLALRSIADAAQTAETDTGTQSGAVKVVRYGVVTKVTTRK